MRLTKLALWLCVLLLLFGCAPRGEVPADAPRQQQPAPTQEPQADATPRQSAEPISPDSLLGFVIEDDGELTTYMAMYGFLRTCENLGRACKLYRAKAGEEAVAAVEQAAQEGCEGILIENANGKYNAAVERAIALGMKAAVPFERCEVQGLSVNVVADSEEYVDELARGIAQRMTERGLKSGRILLYGYDVSAYEALFARSLNTYYPQFTLSSFLCTAQDKERAVEELSEYILYNRDIKGMYIADTKLVPIAVEARNKAISRFKAEGAPSPTPALTPLPADAPTPNPALLNQISITAFGNGLSDENLTLFEDNDIYALCIEPYYDASAQCVMLLDKLLGGGEVSGYARVNRPIAYADTIDKYLAVYKQAKEMFGF